MCVKTNILEHLLSGAFQPRMFCQNIFSWTATATKISLHSLGIPDALFWAPPSHSKMWSFPPFWEPSLEVFYICLIRKGYFPIISGWSSTVLQSSHFSLGYINYLFHHLLVHLGTKMTLSQEPQALLTWCHRRVSAGRGAHERRRSALRSWCSFPWSLSHGCRFQSCSSAGDTSSLCLQ